MSKTCVEYDGTNKHDRATDELERLGLAVECVSDTLLALASSEVCEENDLTLTLYMLSRVLEHPEVLS